MIELTLLQLSLFYGLILSVVMSALIFGSLYINPEMWLQDAPSEIQAKHGPMSETAKRQRAWLATLMFTILIGLVVLSLLQLIERAGARVRGFHIFTGAQNLSAGALVDAQRMAFETGARLAEGLADNLAWLNIGGGFGVPYFPGEMPLDLAPVAEGLSTLCDLAASRLRAPLVLELGRYLVSAAGVYVCRVRDRKLSQGHPFVVVDGGLHHHLAASGNFGQVLRKNYPVAIGNRLGETDREVQTVVGPLCTPLDLLADRMALAPARIGDLVVVFQSGAYGPTASPQTFLSHPAPNEVLV